MALKEEDLYLKLFRACQHFHARMNNTDVQNKAVQLWQQTNQFGKSEYLQKEQMVDGFIQEFEENAEPEPKTVKTPVQKSITSYFSKVSKNFPVTKGKNSFLKFHGFVFF